MTYKPPSPAKRSVHPHEKALDAIEAQLSTMKNMDATQRDALLVLSKNIAQLKDDQKKVTNERLVIEKSKIPTSKIPTTPRKSVSPLPSPDREDSMKIVNIKETEDPFQVSSTPGPKHRAITVLNQYETPVRKSSLFDSPFKSITRGISSRIDNSTTSSPAKTSTRIPSTYKTVYSPGLIPLTLQPSHHSNITSTSNSKPSLAPSMSPTRLRTRASSVDQATQMFSWSGVPSLFLSNTSESTHSPVITPKEESFKSTRVPINFRFERPRGEMLLESLTKIDRSFGAALGIETKISGTNVALDLSVGLQRDSESSKSSRPVMKDASTMTTTTVNGFFKQSRSETRDDSNMHYDGVSEGNKSGGMSQEGNNNKYYIHIDPSQAKNLRRRTLPPSIDVLKVCENLPHNKPHNSSVSSGTTPQITPPFTTTATSTATATTSIQSSRKQSESSNYHKGRIGSHRWNSADITASPSQVIQMQHEALFPEHHTEEPSSALRKKLLELQNQEDQESDIALEELIDVESKRDLSSSYKDSISSASPPPGTSSSKRNSSKATDYTYTLSKLGAGAKGTNNNKCDKIRSSFLGGSMYTGRATSTHSRSLSSGFEIKSKEYQAGLGRTLKRRSRPVSHGGGDGKFGEKKPLLEGSDDERDVSSPVFL